MRTGHFSILAAAAAISPVVAFAQNAGTLESVDAYGNFHAGGVVAEVSGDANGDARATLEVRAPGGDWAMAHPLVRAGGRLVGSLFRLEPATTYDVRVTLVDPDGVDGSPVETTLTTRDDTPFVPDGRTIHVEAGAVGGDGSEARPFGTIQAGVDAAGAGDLVLVHPGVYFETVAFSHGGAPGRPLTVRGEEGATVDGASPALLAGEIPWRDEGGGVWSADLGHGTGHVVVDGERLYRFADVPSLAALAPSIVGGYYSDGATLFVNVGGDPSGALVEAARFEDGFFVGDVADVVVEGIAFRNFGEGDHGKGVYVRYSSRVVVRDCDFEKLHRGVWVKGGGEVLVEGSTFHEPTISDWPWDAVKGSEAETSAITVSDDVGRGVVLRGNRISGFFNGMGNCGSSMTEATSEFDVHGNTVFDINDDAFEPDGTCANVRFWGNVAHDVHMGFSISPVSPGPTWLLRNVVHRHGNARPHLLEGFGASPIKLNNGYDDVTGIILAYHNTFATDVADANGLSLDSPGNWDVLFSRNNVYVGTMYTVYYVNLGTDGEGPRNSLDMDWDALYTTDPDRFFRWAEERVESIERLAADHGQEENGIVADPAFEDFDARDVRLTETSPLVDRGVYLPGVNEGFRGEAPDIGAIELGDDLPDADSDTDGDTDSDSDSDTDGDGDVDGGSGGRRSEGGCGCGTTGSGTASGAILLVLVATASRRRRAQARATFRSI